MKKLTLLFLISVLLLSCGKSTNNSTVNSILGVANVQSIQPEAGPGISDGSACKQTVIDDVYNQLTPCTTIALFETEKMPNPDLEIQHCLTNINDLRTKYPQLNCHLEYFYFRLAGKKDDRFLVQAKIKEAYKEIFGEMILNDNRLSQYSRTFEKMYQLRQERLLPSQISDETIQQIQGDLASYEQYKP